MLRRLYLFFCGYLRLRITDCRVEGLINRLLRQGIDLWAVERINNTYYVNIRAEDFAQLEALLDQTECQVTIDSKHGVPFLIDRLTKRWGLIIGVIFLLVVVFGLSKFIFLIEIKGAEEIEPVEIKQVLAEYEIKPGVLKTSISVSDLEKLLVQKKQRLGWVHIYFQGVKLVVEVKEKELVEVINDCDIVAAKAGIITDLIVLKGNPQVKEGMTVSQGQVLISRQVPINKQKEKAEEDSITIKEYKKVKAAGIAKARVWYQGYGEAHLVRYYQQPTKNSCTSVTVKYKNKEILVSGPKTPPYANFKVEEEVKTLPEWRNYSLPVEVITRRYIQLKEFTAKRSLKQAKNLAKRKALDNVLQRLSKESIILNSQFKLIEANQTQKLVRVKALVEVKEDIAIRRE